MRRDWLFICFTIGLSYPLLSLSQEPGSDEVPPPPSDVGPAVEVSPTPEPSPAEPGPAEIPVEKAPETPPPLTSEEEAVKRTEPLAEFRELSLAIRPGFGRARTHPPGLDDSGFALGGHLTLFLHKWVGLNVPYTYSHYDSNSSLHTIGGGPQFRFLDWGPFRGGVDVNALYARAFGGNHIGWSVGGDLTVGLKKVVLRPFFGPFFRYEHIYLPGNNFGAWEFGAGLTLTNYADID